MFRCINVCFVLNSNAFFRFSSYNPFNHNVYRDAWIISGMDTFTSLFAGFTIFSVLGNLAYTLEVDIEDVAKAGKHAYFYVSGFISLLGFYLHSIYLNRSRFGVC